MNLIMMKIMMICIILNGKILKSVIVTNDLLIILQTTIKVFLMVAVMLVLVLNFNWGIIMFNLDNTNGFTQAQLDLMNSAIARLMEEGIDESHASDRVNNNWMSENNTIDSLCR